MNDMSMVIPDPLLFTDNAASKVRALIDFLARRWAGTPPWDQGLDRL